MSHLLAASELAYKYVPLKKFDTGIPRGSWPPRHLVLLMTPALAFFYGGMVRAKHTLAMLMQNFAAIAIVSVTWVLIGFTWAFSGDGKWLGDTALRVPAAHRRRGTDARERAGDPDDGVRRVPAHVRDHHAGADHGLDRRSLEVRRVRRLRCRLVDLDLRAGRALGVRRVRLAEPLRARAWRALLRRGLRWWDGRAHQRRRGRSRDGLRARQAQGLAEGADARPQHPVRPARRRPAVVRLVRLQRRIRTGCRRCGGRGVDEHQHRNRDRPDRAGSSRRSSATASRQRWAPRPARSQAWSRSHPAPVG